MVEDNTIPPEGYRFIENLESFRPTPYRDSGGVWTWGYGQTGANPPPYVSLFDAEQQLKSVLDHVAGEIYLPPTYTGAQKTAILSVAYNAGTSAVLSSSWFKLLLARDLRALELWVKWYLHDKEGHFLPGLAARRQKEVALFVYGFPVSVSTQG